MKKPENWICCVPWEKKHHNLTQPSVAKNPQCHPGQTGVLVLKLQESLNCSVNPREKKKHSQKMSRIN